MGAGRVLLAYSAGRIVMSGVLSWAPPPKTAQHASDNFARSSAQAKYIIPFIFLAVVCF